VADLLRSARALIMTSIEEFGLVAVESQAAGRPVIARRGGGALETIIDGVTGRFWSGGADELAQAVLEFDDAAVDPAACVRNADRFDTARFRAGMTAEIARARATRERLPDGERHPRMYMRRVRRAPH
jgi:glycosyltransferase involved in cell wall biosynthesis